MREAKEIFLNHKNCPQPLFSNNEWLWKLAFAADIVGYINEFNLKLQGRTVLIYETYAVLQSYLKKFELFEALVTLITFDYFSCCKKFQIMAKSTFPKRFRGDYIIRYSTAITKAFFQS